MSAYNFNIDKVNEIYGSTFVGYFPTKTKSGWGYPAAVFYQPNPKTELGHSNYFGLYVDDYNPAVIFNADYITKGWEGVKADNGELVWSEHRHDYHESKDGSVWVDGGFDYIRTGTPERIVKLNVKDGVVYEVKD
jgi:hypothetical protein